MNPEWLKLFLLFAPDDGGGSGEGDNDTSGDHDDDSQQDQGATAFQRTLKRYNDDGIAFARELFDDNYKYRRKINRLSRDLDAAKKLPEGSVILSAQDAQDWQSYKALGKPDEVKTAVEERGQFQEKLTTLERNTILRDVATAAGYKYSVLENADLLAKAKGKSLIYSVKDVEQDGVKTPTAFVKDGDSEKPLKEFAQEHWADLLPSLAMTSESENGTTTRTQGTPYPAQHQGTGGNQPKTAVAQTKATLEKRYAKPATP